MPYYQRSWNVALGDKPLRQRSKKLRSVPANAFEEEQAKVAVALPKEAKVEKSKVASFRDKLNKNVQELQMVKAAKSVNGSNYLDYAVQNEKVIFSGVHSKILGCTNTQYGNTSLICREFYPSSLINPDTDLHLKLLRYTGNKSPNIIQTMDIFLDQKGHIFLFQEQANRGNALDYIRGGGEIEEQEMRKWAHSIYKALDYLGTIGVSHRAIQPKHIQVQYIEANKESRVKLAGFRDAIVYWDPNTNDIIDQPCQPTSLMKQMYFNSPESFGHEGEFFNPLEADIWSFGATMFFVVSRLYPFNSKAPKDNLDGEIRTTIGTIEKLSDPAKYWLYGLMRTNTKQRTEFDAIAQNGWFSGSSSSLM